MNEEEKKTKWEKIKPKVTVVAVVWTVICAVVGILLYLWYKFEDDEDYNLDDDAFDYDDWWNDDYKTAQEQVPEDTAETTSKKDSKLSEDIIITDCTQNSTSGTDTDVPFVDEQPEKVSVPDDDWEEYDFFDFDDDVDD